MPVRIGFNLLWLVPGDVGGSEDATITLLRALAQSGRRSDEGIDVVPIVTPTLSDAYPELAANFEVHTIDLDSASRLRRVVAENVSLAREVAGLGLDVMHHGGGTLPFMRFAGRRRRLPTSVTIHDLQPLDQPENFSLAKRVYLRSSLARVAAHADAIAVPSEFVRSGVIDRFDIDPETVFVAPWCVTKCEPEGRSDASPYGIERHGIERPFLLYPAVMWPHKNHRFLLDVFTEVAERVDVDLVLTGGNGPLTETVEAQISASTTRDRIHVLGRVERGELDALMASATALVFPSTYEGFGIPLLEAMVRGTPVVVSNRGALPEVLGDSSAALDPSDADSWVERLVELCADDEAHALASRGARAEADRFGRDRTAGAYLDMWQSLRRSTS